MTSERICVLGAGSWGATLAGVLAEKGHDVSLWEFDAKAAESLDKTRRLSFLPDLRLPAAVRVTHDIAQAAARRAVIVSVTPSAFVRSTMKTLRASKALDSQAIVVSATKGLEDKTLKRMSQIIEEELSLPSGRIAVLSGPSHAEELCKRQPTAIVAASTDNTIVPRVQALFSQDYFRIYAHSDPAGVELAAALKNVFAIGCGISDGLGFGDNAKAALMTRGLNEMTRIGVQSGANVLTFFGLAGVGDLIVTCLSRHSRNRALGEKIGKGKTPKEALAEMTMVAEGMISAPAANELARRANLDCPLTREIYDVLYQDKDPQQSLKDLMRRETPTEWQGLPALELH